MRAEALIVYLWLLCGALTGCGGHGSPPPVRPVTIADPWPIFWRPPNQ